MNILVTGVAGFIGSHVCENFVGYGHHIIGIDNFDDFYPVKSKQLNLAELQEIVSFNFMKLIFVMIKLLHSIFA